ncbi:MAG: nucleotidyltransferase domain-containing protein [Anaerolineae bacterium]
MTVQFAVTLDEIVNRLVAGLHPERIYLFGSRARGQNRTDSDYDLLIILPESDLPRHRREAHAYDLLWGIPIPVDLLVMTRSEFQRSHQVKTSLAATVLREGELLYG